VTTEEIREIVRITLEELINNKAVKLDSYDSVLDYVSQELTNFFNDKKCDPKVSPALKLLSDDYYIDIIYLQYRDEKTIEWIAEYFERDESTILRNKKRLIYKLYEEMKK
jgi:hypothetical protein